MRYKYIAGIFIAAILLYLSIYGAAGIGLTLSLGGTFYKEDFITLGNWEVQLDAAHSVKINPAGQLEMRSPNGTGDDRRVAMQDSTVSMFPAQYTVEWRMFADRIAASGGTPTVAGEQDFTIYTNSYWVPLAFRATHISAYQGSLPAVTYNVNIQGAWHVWTLVVNSGANNVDLWMDSLKIMSFPTISVGSTNRISLDGYGGAAGSGLDTLAHIDYIYVDDGLHPPAMPATATLHVNTSPVTGITVTVNGTTKLSNADFTGLTLGTISLSVPATFTSGSDSYTWSSWSNGGSRSQNYNLQADATLTATYTLDLPTTGSIVATCTLDGNPYSGVIVTVSGISGQYTSGADGKATVPNVPGTTYSVIATPPNGLISPQTQSSVTVIGGQPTNLNFPFTTPVQGTGNIYVNAVDSSSNTIVNTPCTVTLTGPTSVTPHTTPWTFTNLAYGTYPISATWKGESQSDSKTVSSGSPSASSTLHFSSSDSGSITYTLQVNTQNTFGSDLGLSVQAHGETKASPASFSGITSGESVTVVVPSSSGSFSFKYWSDDVANTATSRTITVTSGRTLVAVYGASGPDFDLRAIFDNPSLRQLELIGGIIGFIVSLLMLFMPASRQQYSSSYYS